MVSTKGLRKHYRSGESVIRAVADVSFSINRGEFVAIVGRSGSGKSTLMSLLGLLERPDAGQYVLNGADVGGLHEDARAAMRSREIGFVFQLPALLPRASALENTELPLGYAGVRAPERHRRAAAALERVGLGARRDHWPHQLSGGEQQRVALARALITKPRVLLLDEPLSALDEFLRLRMRGELKRLQVQLGITFVHVTHTQPEAIALADTVVVMNQGSIEQAAAPVDIYALPRSPYVARFMGGQNVVKGKVRAIEGDTALLDGPEGSRIRVRLTGRKLAVGEEAYVAIRRDKIVLTRGGDAADGGENSARGVVETVEYQGLYFKVTLAKLAGEEFIAMEQEATFFAHPINAGDTTVASWQTDAVHLLEVDRGAGGIQPYSEDATA